MRRTGAGGWGLCVLVMMGGAVVAARGGEVAPPIPHVTPTAPPGFTNEGVALEANPEGWIPDPFEPDARLKGKNLLDPSGASELRRLEIPDYAVRCPACRAAVHQVDLRVPDASGTRRVFNERWLLAADELDVDLCPHPTSRRIRFQADVTCCPHCGFAARQPDFVAPAPGADALAAWVERTVTPRVVPALMNLVAETPPEAGAPVPAEARRRIARIFAKQEDIPDVLRMESARLYYAFAGAAPDVQSRMEQLTAWAYRRAVNVPPIGAFILEGQKPVLDALHLDGEANEDPLQRIPRLQTLLTRKNAAGRPLFTWHQRQCAQFALAGLYARAGLLPYARFVLDTVARQAAAAPESPEDDPMWPDLPMGASREENISALQARRVALHNVARAHARMVDLEGHHLSRAADLLAEALDRDETMDHWRDLPARMFLVGEWLRRRGEPGQLARAALWLRTAREMATQLHRGDVRAAHFDRDGLELFAADQMKRLTEFHAALPANVRPDLDAADPAERVRVARLAQRYWTARDEALADYRATLPPVAPATPEDNRP